MNYNRFFLSTTLLYLVIPISVFANSNLPDSIKHAINKKESIEKVRFLRNVINTNRYATPKMTAECAKEILDLGKKKDNQRWQAVALFELGFSSQMQSDFTNAYEYYLKGYDVARQMSNDTMSISFLNAMGTIQQTLKNNIESISRFKEAERYANKIGNTYVSSTILMNIGACFTDLKQTDSALFYSEKAYLQAKQYGYNAVIAPALGNMAILLNEKKEYEKAYEYLSESLSIFKESGDQRSYLVYLYLANLSEAELNLGRLSEAKEHALQAYRMADSLRLQKIEVNALDKLYKICEQQNNLSDAVKYFKLYDVAKDSVYSNETQEKIIELSTKYETEKKDKQIALQELKIERNRKLLVFIFSSLFISLLLLSFFIMRNKMLLNLLRKNIDLMKAEDQLSLVTVNEESCVILPPQNKDDKYKKSSLSDDSREKLSISLEKVIQSQKLWKQSDITVEKVALLLNTNSKYLSQIINQTYGLTFPNYINEYRVKEARSLLFNDEYNQYTLEAIGQLTGFNSYSSFIAAFRKCTGLTPSFFRNNYEKVYNKGLGIGS